jgi:hypothetical protein
MSRDPQVLVELDNMSARSIGTHIMSSLEIWPSLLVG